MRHVTLTISILLLASCGAPAPADRPGWADEVVYHVVQRSFFDSDGDRNGDFEGLKTKLPYLDSLGVTAILTLPIVESDFYHNYFPTDYEAIDPEFGSMRDWTVFVRAAHARGMKVILDMETQYAATGHPWLDSSYANPESPDTPFVAWQDSTHTTPVGIFGLDTVDPVLPAWPDLKRAVVTLDLNAPEVRAWMEDYFAFWADPNGDGSLDDGVDGFRIDHIMDDLDYRGLFTDLYRTLWRPVFERARSVNPDLFIIGEQADWTTFGDRMIAESGADAAFGFPIRFAISGTSVPTLDSPFEPNPDAALDPVRIADAVRATVERMPPGASWFTFLENHDTPRWATVVGGRDGMIRAGAVLIMTLPGIPSIYYGQELGLSGRQGRWNSDANDIPVREAFPWSPDPDAPGMATWYRGSGPWWEGSIYRSGESARRALPVEESDPESVWFLYHTLISLRRERAELQRGDFDVLLADSTRLVFTRSLDEDTTAIVLNLSAVGTTLDLGALGLGGYRMLIGPRPDESTLPLDPYGFAVLTRR